jgi:hypothetical protein
MKLKLFFAIFFGIIVTLSIFGGVLIGWGYVGNYILETWGYIGGHAWVTISVIALLAFFIVAILDT